MPEFKQVEAEKSLLESFFKFAGIKDVSIAAQRQVTKHPGIHDEWNSWVAQRAARRQETPVSSFFELERRRHKPDDNNLYLVPSRPLLSREWSKVAPLFTALENAPDFKTAIRVTTEDQRVFTIKKPGL